MPVARDDSDITHLQMRSNSSVSTEAAKVQCSCGEILISPWSSWLHSVLKSSSAKADVILQSNRYGQVHFIYFKWHPIPVNSPCTHTQTQYKFAVCLLCSTVYRLDEGRLMWLILPASLQGLEHEGPVAFVLLVFPLCRLHRISDYPGWKRFSSTYSHSCF